MAEQKHNLRSTKEGHIPTWLSLFKYSCFHPVSIRPHPLPIPGVVLEVLKAEVVLRQFGTVKAAPSKVGFQSREKKIYGHCLDE